MGYVKNLIYSPNKKIDMLLIILHFINKTKLSSAKLTEKLKPETINNRKAKLN